MPLPPQRRYRSPLHLALLAGTALVAPCAVHAQRMPASNAAPVLDRVVTGGITIEQDAARTQVTQTQQRGIVDWRSFDVGRDHTVQFRQPSSTAATLNRVTGPDPSVIAGRVSANGQLVIVNQSGVVFAQGAQVEAAGLVASAAGITNQAFLNGGNRLVFDQAPKPGARVENAGTITVKEAGLAGLVAPQVVNRGTIAAKLGHVALGGAEAAVVDLHGDGLVSLEIVRPVGTAPADGEALVTNTGTIDAQGGTVLLTARAADGIVQNLVRAGGRIGADTTAGGRTGEVALRGTGGAIIIEGEVSATGTASGTTGGTVEALGDRVLVAGTARVDASGRAGGGRIGIGAQGRVGTPRVARRAGTAAGAVVRADATENGSGGTVRIDSTDYTAHAGTVSARGGPQGGDGGMVEISGGLGLRITGGADVSAPVGRAGTVLLDPDTLEIVSSGGNVPPGDIADGVLDTAEGPFNATIDAALINGISGGLELQANSAITVNAAIIKPTGDLKLTAGTNSTTITVNAPITLDAGDLTLTAGSMGGVALNANLAANNVTLSAGTSGIASASSDLTVQATSVITVDASISKMFGDLTLTAGTTITVNADLDLTTSSSSTTLALSAGAGGIVQNGGAIRAENLTIQSDGNVLLTSASNQIGTLLLSDVTGNLSLTTSGTLNLDQTQTVSGTMRLNTNSGGLQQTSGGSIQASRLEMEVGSAALTGANRIAVLGDSTANRGNLEIRNVTALRTEGTVSSDNGSVAITVEGGDLNVDGTIRTPGDITLHASRSIMVGLSGFVEIPTSSSGVLHMEAAFDGSATDLAAPGGVTLEGRVETTDSAFHASAGTGGIIQTGGYVVADSAEFASGGSIILDRGGAAGGTPNAIDSFAVSSVNGDFVLDNGNTRILPSSDIAADNIGLRTSDTIEGGGKLSLLAPGGRISLRAGTVSADTFLAITGSTVEIAPDSTAAMTVGGTGTGFSLTGSDLAVINASDTLRLGATTFRNTLTTTASAVRFVAPISVANRLDLRSTGTIGQDSGADIAASRLAGAAGGAVTLTNAGNTISVLEDFAAGSGFDLTTQGALTLAGHLDGTGQAVNLTAGGAIGSSGAGRVSAQALGLAANGAIVLTGANAVRTLGSAATDGTSDITFVNAAPSLDVPSGVTVETTGAIAITQNGGPLTIDGTVRGGTTTLSGDTQVAVNGFSAIATAGDLVLTAPVITVDGLIFATGDILLTAAQSATLAGQALAPGGSLVVAAPGVTFGGLDASGTAVRLDLGQGGAATGALDALSLLVAGGSGVTLTGTIAGITGGAAAAIGRRADAAGTIYTADPPPDAFDFTFNGCAIASSICAASVPPPPPPPSAAAGPFPALLVNNPAATLGVLDPGLLSTSADRLRPPAPDLIARLPRDESEEDTLAPADIRGDDY